MTVKIVVRPNGPYMISGDLALLDLQDDGGNSIDVAGKTKVFLCRCGASMTKPFCDGQHTRIGFQAAADFISTG